MHTKVPHRQPSLPAPCPFFFAAKPSEPPIGNGASELHAFYETVAIALSASSAESLISDEPPPYDELKLKVRELCTSACWELTNRGGGGKGRCLPQLTCTHLACSQLERFPDLLSHAACVEP